jgi:hypothetical protein
MNLLSYRCRLCQVFRDVRADKVIQHIRKDHDEHELPVVLRQLVEEVQPQELQPLELPLEDSQLQAAVDFPVFDYDFELYPIIY